MHQDTLEILYIESLDLYFLLLVLRIPLDLSLNASYKQRGFSKTLPKKDLEFFLNGGNNTLIFNMSFIPVPAEVDLMSEEQSCTKNAFKIYGTSHVKMILVLLAEVIIFYILVTIV